MQTKSAVLNVLSDRYDALDDALHDSDIPFVELGSEGRIVYANAAFDELVPDGHGTPFADLFRTRAADVCAALRADGNTSLRLDIQTAAATRQVRVEIGPLRDEGGERGNYVLLLDQSAEQSRLNALQDACSGPTSLAGFGSPTSAQQRSWASPKWSSGRCRCPTYSRPTKTNPRAASRNGSTQRRASPTSSTFVLGTGIPFRRGLAARPISRVRTAAQASCCCSRRSPRTSPARS